MSTNWWLWWIWLALVLTTPFNPLVNNAYFTIWWYAIVHAFGLWVLVRVIYKKKEGGAQ